MGKILKFPRHTRASSRVTTGGRAAKLARVSASKPAALARSVPSRDCHHSAGMLSRCHHLLTCGAVAPPPISDAAASLVGQSSMTDRNDVSMLGNMGQFVPKSKAIVSRDYDDPIRHNVPVNEHDENRAESAWREAFRQRLIAAQGARTNADMAELLGITATRYSKYRGSRKSLIPLRLLPTFCKICGISLESLIEGKSPVIPSRPLRKRRRPAA